MRKVEYPIDIGAFKVEFLKRLSGLDQSAREWSQLWQNNPNFQNLFPKRLNKIILANYHKLTRYYQSFCKLVKSLSAAESDALKIRLSRIFDYDKHQSQIADYFMEHADDMNLSVCHYCESAYINAYSVDSDRMGLKTINIADKEKLIQILNVADFTANKVIRNRPFHSINSFNLFWINNVRKSSLDKFHSIFHKNRHINHFDIDHVLDKGSCPIVAISLMNFVPCCQVCNEKLKRSKVLGDYVNNVPWVHLSPTSHGYDFDTNVTIRIKNNDLILTDPAYALKYRDKYSIVFDCLNPDFENFVDVFNLEARYSFHKVEGLRWLELKSKYPDSAIKMIATALTSPIHSIERIREDIFTSHYDKIRKPCFL